MANNNIDDVIAQLRSYDALAEDAASRHGVDPNIIKAMMSQESAYNPKAVSAKGAQGLMQLMPETAKELGVQDVMDPAQNIEGGVKYFASLLKRYGGDQSKALAAYNAGPGNVDSGKADKFAETQNYVRKILANVPQAQDTKAPQAPVAQQPQDIESQIAALRAADNQSVPTQANRVVSKQANTVKPPAKPESFLERVTDYLPMAGGAVGGAFGGVGGAAAGGAAGQGYKDIIDHATEIPGAIWDVVNNLFDKNARAATVKGFGQGALEGTGQALKEGAIQGATEGAGKLLQVAGKGLVKKAFAPTAKMLESNPHIVEDIIEAGVNPTSKGLNTSKAAVDAARNEADAAVAKASASGVKIQPTDIRDALIDNPYTLPNGRQAKSVIDEISEMAEQDPALNRVAKFENNFLSAHPNPMDPVDVLALRRSEGKAASKVFEGAFENPSLESRLHAAAEQGARNQLEKAVPGWEKLNDITQNKMQVMEAVQNAIERRASENPSARIARHVLLAGPGAALGYAANPLAGLATVALTEAAANPTVQATTGRALFKAAPTAVKLIRTGQAIGTGASHGKSKSQVDFLYQRYRSQDDQQD